MVRTMSFLTLVQAAERLGVAPATLRAQIHRGKLNAQKLGRDWLVDSAEVERYKAVSQNRTTTPTSAGPSDHDPAPTETP